MSIYLDNSATTKIRKEALDKYISVSENTFGNPSSLHAMGLDAEKELNYTRGAVLSSLMDRQSEVIFTASGSEANNLAIFGRAYAKERYRRGARIITTEGEHASVSSPLTKLAEEGFDIVYIPTRSGVIDLDALKAALTKNTVLVTLMMVNNETGALYDIASVSALTKSQSPEALIHVDATQSYLKVPFTKKSIGADMITISSHKIEGPKGVGALVVDRAVIKNKGLAPQILGGGQEMGLRSGTENVPAIAAFGTAVTLGYSELIKNNEKLSMLRSYLVEKLSTDAAFSHISMTLAPKFSPHILNITLPGIKSETMLHFLSSLGVFVSSGSACSSNSRHVSSALTAYGRSADEADASIRISFSHRNEISDIDAFLSALADGVSKLARMKR